MLITLSNVFNFLLTPIHSDTNYNDNLHFYLGKIEFKPNGIYINDLLNNKQHDKNYLENNHSYIQWIFPTLSNGQNRNAYPFNTYELKVRMKFYFISF